MRTRCENLPGWSLALVLLVLANWMCGGPLAAQLILDRPGVPASIDFGGFDGTGFSPSPSPGQLDSHTLSIVGMSEGDLPFETTAESGDYARGTTAGGITSGGVYAFDLGDGDMALGFQPTGSDFTPGALTLHLENRTASPLDRILVTYDVVVFNDQGRSTSWNLSFAREELGPYEAVPAADFASPETADEEPAYTLVERSLELSLLPILPGEPLYLRFTSDDSGGTGSRDEIGIDNISILGQSSLPDPDLIFGDGFESGDSSLWSDWAE